MELERTVAECLMWYTPVHLVLVCYVIWFIFSIYKEQQKGGPLQFHLIEMLAGVIAIAPTMLAFTQGLKSWHGVRSAGDCFWLVLAVLIGLSQLSGMLMGLMQNIVPRANGAAGSWEQAGWILLWALGGILLVPAGFGMTCLVLLGLPILLPLAVFYVLAKAARYAWRG